MCYVRKVMQSLRSRLNSNIFGITAQSSKEDLLLSHSSYFHVMTMNSGMTIIRSVAVILEPLIKQRICSPISKRKSSIFATAKSVACDRYLHSKHYSRTQPHVKKIPFTEVNRISCFGLILHTNSVKEIPRLVRQTHIIVIAIHIQMRRMTWEVDLGHVQWSSSREIFLVSFSLLYLVCYVLICFQPWHPMTTLSYNSQIKSTWALQKTIYTGAVLVHDTLCDLLSYKFNGMLTNILIQTKL